MFVGLCTKWQVVSVPFLAATAQYIVYYSQHNPLSSGCKTCSSVEA